MRMLIAAGLLAIVLAPGSFAEDQAAPTNTTQAVTDQEVAKGIEKRIMDRLYAIEQRLTAIEAKLGNSSFDSLGRKLDEMRRQLDNMERDVDDLERRR
jgi:archaellum component FlaC